MVFPNNPPPNPPTPKEDVFTKDYEEWKEEKAKMFAQQEKRRAQYQFWMWKNNMVELVPPVKQTEM